jgi:hypothetical protein
MAANLKIAVSKAFSMARFIADSPANANRPVETTRFLENAKTDFTDQTSVDNFCTARGGAAGTYVVVDLGAAGVT